MKKLTIDEIQVELTRECNMKPQCNHCFRGDAQSIRIDKKYIDLLLDQTEIIGSIFFTGGEPLLCLDEMNYLLDQLYTRGIPLFEFNIITNGLIFNDEVVAVIKRYSDMIKLCKELGTKKQVDIENSIIVGVSIDKYHNHLEVAKLNIEKLRSALKGYAQVVKTAGGNLPMKEGRGKVLSNGLLCSNIGQNQQKRIEILDKTHKPMCPQYQLYKMVKPEQVIVCCGVYLNAKGYLMPSGLGLHDYSVVDDPSNHICHVTEPIYENIILYNQGKIDCCTSLKKVLREAKANPFDLQRMHDTLYTLLYSQDDDSDPIKRDTSGQSININDYVVNGALNEENINRVMINAAKKDYLKGVTK